jgi:hypothetical protein
LQSAAVSYQHAFDLSQDILSHAAGTLTKPLAAETQPAAVGAVLLAQVVASLEAKGAEPALALVLDGLVLFELLGGFQSHDVADSLTVLDVHVVNLNACDFLHLGYLRAEPATVIVTRYQQFAVF